MQIGLWTRPEEIAKGHLDYSQSITANMLEYLEAHFNHPYLPIKSGNQAYACYPSNNNLIRL